MIKQPLSFYTDENSLSFHLLDVGEGLMHLIIFPDKTVMLFDCNVTNDKEDSILEYLEGCIPEKYNIEKKENEKVIDIFVNSHRDEDHYRGLKKVNDKFKIKSIWDSGQTGETTSSDDYKYYMDLRRKLKNNNSDNLLVPIPTDIPIRTYGNAKIYCLATSEDFHASVEKAKIEEAAKIQHTNSIVLLIEYGQKRLMLTGDSDWKSWKEKIVPNFEKKGLLKSDILIASHHGSRSFFTDEINDNIDLKKNPETTYIKSIEIIKPTVVLIPCGDYNSAHHPNKDALELYKKNTDYEQVFTTYEQGNLCGFINNKGEFTVVPSIFFSTKSTNGNIGFKIKCKVDSRYELQSNSEENIEKELLFSVDSYGGLIEPFNKIDVTWQVSNGGIGDYAKHQEIYYKGSDETEGKLSFKRKLAYKGVHLLRCRIYNSEKCITATQIFVVRGI